MKMLFMRKFIRVAVVIFATAFAAGAQVNLQWEVRYDHPTAHFIDKAVEIELDAAGNTYVVGTSFNGANYDIRTIKYNNAGVEQWNVVYNGPGNGLDEAFGIALDASNDVFITGSAFNGGSDYDILTRKINGATGATMWTHLNTGTANYDAGRDITVDNTGRVIVVGYVSTGPTNLDVITMSFPNAGAAPTWTAIQDNTTSGSANDNDQAKAVVTDGSGNIYVAAHAENTTGTTYFDFWLLKYASGGGAPLINTEYNGVLNNYDTPSALALGADGHVVMVGQAYTNALDEYDYMTKKINGTTGAIIWTQFYAGDAEDLDKISAVATDASNNVYITGQSKSLATSEDYYTVKYNSAGTEQWNHRFSSAGLEFDSGTDLELSASGTYLYVTGYSYEAADNNDYTTVKYATATGNLEWSIQFDGPASLSDQALKLELDATENIYVTGNSHGGPTTNLDYSTIKYCQLVAVAETDTAICIGESVVLSVTGGTSPQWAVLSGDGTSLSCTSCASPTADPNVTTVYTASITSASGCVDYDTVTVTVNPLPTPTIYYDTPLDFCIGFDVELYTDTYASYSWSPGGATDSFLVVSTAGTYTVTVTDDNGCQNSTNETVSTYSLPPVDAGPSDDVCVGGSTVLGASGAVDYLWAVNPTLSLLTIPNPTATPTSDTWYYVTGEDVNGCEATDSVFINVNPLPTVSAGPDGGSVCLNDSIQLLATGAINYTWTFHPTLSDLDIADPWAQPTTLTEYFVAGEDANGCIDIDSVTISTINLPNIMILGDVDTAVCIGDSVQLTTTGGLAGSYVWDPSSDLSSLTISNPWASPAVDMDFAVEGTDINGCSNKDTITVVVNSLPAVSAGADDGFCIGDSIQLLATGAVDYLWNFHPSLSEVDIANPWATPVTSPINYTVTGTDANGCVNTDAVTISIYSLPTVNITGDDEICDNDSTQLTATGAVTYVWNFDFTLSNILIADPWATPVSDQWYYVTGFDVNGCEDTASHHISVLAAPPAPVITQDSCFLISNYLSGNQWVFEGDLIPGATDDTLNYYLYGFNGHYWLLFTDPFTGCTSMSDTVLNQIIIVDVGIDEQEAFGVNVYPNPTNGVVSFVLDQDIDELMIADASGKILMKTGTMASGINEIDLSALPSGTYFVRLLRSDQVISLKLIKN
jgi:hypothetical protein